MSDISLRNGAAFEFDGEKYRAASRHQKEWGSKIISELKLRGDEHVLDLGCGDAVLTEQLARLVPRGLVLGIDTSHSMINTAKRLEKSNLSFRLMDISKINFENEFDLIFSNATLHWIKDHRRLLDGCHSALRVNGMIRFNFAAEGNCSNLITVIKDVMHSERYAHHFHIFDWPWYMPTFDSYRSLLEKSRFKDIRVSAENADRYFATQEEMVRWIEQPSIVPFLKGLTAEDKKAFRDSVVTKMIHVTRRENGTFFETFRRIDVTAKKDKTRGSVNQG